MQTGSKRRPPSPDPSILGPTLPELPDQWSERPTRAPRTTVTLTALPRPLCLLNRSPFDPKAFPVSTCIAPGSFRRHPKGQTLMTRLRAPRSAVQGTIRLMMQAVLTTCILAPSSSLLNTLQLPRLMPSTSRLPHPIPAKRHHPTFVSRCSMRVPFSFIPFHAPWSCSHRSLPGDGDPVGHGRFHHGNGLSPLSVCA